MNICELINSRSITEYWKQIGYTPSPVTIAWIIYYNWQLTLDERCGYWEEITETMPDMEIPCQIYCNHYNSLHDFLRNYIDLIRRFINRFYDDKDTVFLLKKSGESNYSKSFLTFNALKDYIQGGDWCESDMFTLKKLSINNNPKHPAYITVNKNFDPVMQEEWLYGDFPCFAEEYDILCAFDEMIYLDYPVPW